MEKIKELKPNIQIIGLMSGTSLDGLDIVNVIFNENEFGEISYQITHSETINYTTTIKNELSSAFNADARTIIKLSSEYGNYIGKEVNKFCSKNQISPDLISSHGHTIFHEPAKGFTLQIGNGANISAITNLPTVCDFRTMDVALNGQGAPLVPIGDKLLFSKFDYCLNLGGIANISCKNNDNYIAYDICPMNIPLNYLANLEGFEYDSEGKIAKSGSINSVLLEQLNKLDFYKFAAPKSLGREWVETTFMPLLNTFNDTNSSKLRTLLEHFSIQIAKSISNSNSEILVTGGGALNTFFIETLKNKLPNTIVYVPDLETILFKEALIFAFLGCLRIQNKPNALKSVTGAKNDSIGGALYGNFSNLFL